MDIRRILHPGFNLWLFLAFAVFSVATFFPAPSAWAEKIPDSAWQAGSIEAITSEAVPGPVAIFGNMAVPRIDTITHYTIHGERYVYMADRKTIPRDKSIEVTIHASMSFAVVGATLYLRDEKGKAHKLALIAKSLPSTP